MPVDGKRRNERRHAQNAEQVKDITAEHVADDVVGVVPPCGNEGGDDFGCGGADGDDGEAGNERGYAKLARDGDRVIDEIMSAGELQKAAAENKSNVELEYPEWCCAGKGIAYETPLCRFLASVVLKTGLFR